VGILRLSSKLTFGEASGCRSTCHEAKGRLAGARNSARTAANHSIIANRKCGVRVATSKPSDVGVAAVAPIPGRVPSRDLAEVPKTEPG